MHLLRVGNRQRAHIWVKRYFIYTLFNEFCLNVREMLFIYVGSSFLGLA